MRVLLSCLQSLKPHALPAYAFWRPYFVEGLAEAGMTPVEVPDVDWVEALTHPTGPVLDTWRARTWQRTYDWVKAEHSRAPIDFFLSYLYPEQIDAAAVERIRALGIPTVNFFCDNVRQFRVVPAAFRAFDLHWVPEFEALEMYRAAGLPHLHAPMPAWVPPAMRTWDHAETEGPTFIGSADDLRRRLLAEAIAIGADVRVYGRDWTAVNGSAHAASAAPLHGRRLSNQVAFMQSEGLAAWARKTRARVLRGAAVSLPADRVGPSVSSETYVRLTQEAIVTLGINRVPSYRRPSHRPMVYSRLRDLEAPMLGACYLTEWTEGVAHLYDIGREVETYRTALELAEKIRTLSSDPSRRRQMRRDAQRRALTDHSVATTLRKIISVIK